MGAALKGPRIRKKNLAPAGLYYFRVRPNLPGWAFSSPNTTEFKPKPPASPFFTELFGASLVDASGASAATADRLAGHAVALYFSASWCPLVF